MFRIVISLIFYFHVLVCANELDSFVDPVESHITKSVKTNKEEYLIKDKKDALLMLIKDFEDKGQFLKALRKSNELIESSINPLKLNEAYTIKANLLFSLEQYTEAEKFYHKAYEINPSDLILHNINESKLSRKNLNLKNNNCVKFDLTKKIDFNTRKPIVFNYFGEINAKGTAYLIYVFMDEISKGNCDFHINIDTTGGDPNNSFTVYNILKNLPISISTMNVNRVQSAGMHLFCLGSKRYTNENANFMIHAISWDMTHITPLKLKDIKLQMGLQEKALVKMYGECMSISKDSFNKFTRGNDDWYINASESIKIKLSDEITSQNFIPKKVFYFYN